MLPCGTPLHNGRGSDNAEFIFTTCMLSITEVTVKPLEAGVRGTNILRLK